MDIAINSDDQIILRDLKETDNVGTVPTTSALIMQFIGDIIALQIAMSNNLTSEEFGLTHPGGLIGQVHNTAK
jgi:D-arabinose 5-phosphate isomerase GutQ